MGRGAAGGLRLGVLAMALVLAASPTLERSEAAPLSVAVEDTSVGVVVGFDDAIPSRIPAYVVDAGTVATRIPQLNAIVVETTEDAAERLLGRAEEDPAVTYAERDGPAWIMGEPDDVLYGQQWAPQTVGLPAAWELQAGSHDVSLHVLDSGVDLAHLDLEANLCATGPSFEDPPGPPMDLHGHGTHVAGIAGASINNTLGVAGASQSCLTPVRVLDHAGSGSMSNIAAGVAWSVENGADLISMSLGGVTESTALRQAIQLASERDVVVVTAAGNPGCREGGSQLAYPAAYSSVVAVGALSDPETRASYSPCSEALDVVAPGSEVWSTYQGNAYRTFSGTSMAAPLVSGIVGLLMAENPSLTANQAHCLLRASADPLGETLAFGQGRVNAVAALESAHDPPDWCATTATVTDAPGRADPGDALEACWGVTGAGAAEISHAHLHWRWDDASDAGNDTSGTTPALSGDVPLEACQEVTAPRSNGFLTLQAHGADAHGEEVFSNEHEITVWSYGSTR